MTAPDGTGKTIRLIVLPHQAGQRLDVFLAAAIPSISRVRLRRAINEGQAAVDGRHRKAGYRLRENQSVEAKFDLERPTGLAPEAIPLEVLYEDDDLIAIQKPHGMVVHPARGHWSGTLAAALAFHFQQLSSLGGPARPGIVHRLDRDTSGVMVVAKTDAAHAHLAGQFERREVHKEYLAIGRGVLDRDRDTIQQPIGPHPYQREKMAIRTKHVTSRAAHTFYEVAERFDGFTCLRVFPQSGRTHQIRVHLAHIGCPVVCDPLYAGQRLVTRGEITRDPTDTTVILDRLALHAFRIQLEHPTTGQPISFTAPIPDVLVRFLDLVRQYRRLS